MSPVHVVRRPPALCTDGLGRHGHPELEVLLDQDELFASAEGLLHHMAGYVVESGARLAVGQTIQHGSWLLQVQEGSQGRQRLGAMRDDSGTFRETIDQALIIEDAQRRQCVMLDVAYTPPDPQQLVVVDDDAMAGLPVSGVRYPGPDHMSGWWITSADAAEGTDDLRTVHVPHVITARPDLLQLLALPVGWRFETAQGPSAWFDEAVALDRD